MAAADLPQPVPALQNLMPDHAVLVPRSSSRMTAVPEQTIVAADRDYSAALAKYRQLPGG